MKTNAAFVARCLRHAAFAAGDIDTGFIDRNLKALAPKPGAASPEDLALAAKGVILAASPEIRGPWDIHDGFRIGGDGCAGLVRFRHFGQQLRLASGCVVGTISRVQFVLRFTSRRLGCTALAWLHYIFSSCRRTICLRWRPFFLG